MEALFCGNVKKKKYLIRCDCGSTFIGNKRSNNCIICSSKVTDKIRIQPQMTASEKRTFVKSLTNYSCKECGEKFESEVKSQDEIFCHVCGGADVEYAEDNVNVEEDKVEKSEEVEPENEENQLEKSKEVDSEESKSNAIKEGLQGTLLSGAWVFFDASNNPVFRIDEEDVKDKAFFNDESFIDVVSSLIDSKGISGVVKEFNAKLYEFDEIKSALDLEQFALNKFQADILPNFTKALDVAIRGSLKGFYNDTNKIIEQFSSDVSTLNVPKEDAKRVVQSSFQNYGYDVFMSLIARALELMQKPKDAFSEVEALIKSTGNLTASMEDAESNYYRKRLEAGNVMFSNKEMLSSTTNRVEATRQNLNFRRR